MKPLIELVLEPAREWDASLQAMVDAGTLLWQGASVPKPKTAYLYCAQAGVSLCVPPFKPLAAALGKSDWQARRQESKQGIVRAVKPCPGRIVWDMTAGWGRDAAILASFGADVCMVEKHPILAYMLQDALERAALLGEALPLSLIQSDALEFMRRFTEHDLVRPDVVYLDPMHPARQKTALVKKDLQMLQFLISPTENVAEMLIEARLLAKERVVLKWPAHEPAPMPYQYKIAGQTVHYYVFEPEAAPIGALSSLASS